MSLKKILKKLAGKKPNKIYSPVEFTRRDTEILEHIMTSGVTMTSTERMIATIQACKYALECDIEGDFVECGVWRGGNSIAAKMILEEYKSDRKVFLFDTFAGMTEPTAEDMTVKDQKSAMAKFLDSDKGDYNDWCYASLEDVQQNFVKAGLDHNNVSFIKGDVVQTLAEQANLPEKIAVLRLDTDWYESTKAEMAVLYPLLENRGAFIVDDYGHWDGARRAIEEYFDTSEHKRPLMQYTDYTGRMGIK